MAERADPAEYTEPYLANYAHVPPVGPGICSVCHRGTAATSQVCGSCTQTMAQVSKPAHLVVPITLYEVGGQMWTTLRRYKDGPADVRRAQTTRVAATLARFLGLHEPCVEATLAEPITLVTTVPSTSGRDGPHPLVNAVTRIQQISGRYQPTLALGAVPIGHNHASDHGFVVTSPVAGHTVLLIEDTFTSGARAQSAASALHLAGAKSVAVLTIGRVIDPAFDEACAAVWTNRAKFSFDRCCLEQ